MRVISNSINFIPISKRYECEFGRYFFKTPHSQRITY
jgi:hypothetical protein